MVKGITRQVILVKSPDPKLFEEAIFIVKEEALSREGVSADQVIRQARQAADGYLKGNRAWNRRLKGFPFLSLSGPVWGAAGCCSGCEETTLRKDRPERPVFLRRRAGKIFAGKVGRSMV